MRQAAGTVILAAMAMASAPAIGREATGFIVGGAPIAAPRGYVDMCRTAGAPLCEAEPFAQPRLAEHAASPGLPVIGDDATGSIGRFGMVAALPAASEKRPACLTARTALTSAVRPQADLSFEQTRFSFRLDTARSYDLAFDPAPLMLRTAALRPAAPQPSAACASDWNPSPAPLVVTPAVLSFAAPAEPATAPAFPSARLSQTGGGKSSAAYRQVRDMNRFVNQNVHQRTDESMFGIGEVWRRTGTGRGAQGDCEDLAIEKRLNLIERGFPADRMFFAVVYRGDIGLHTVLIARLNDGDYVLDSLTPHVVPWSRAPYSWISVQSPERPGQWFSVQPAGSTSDGTVIAGRGRQGAAAAS